MNRRITLSMALTLSIVLVTLTSSDSMVSAEPPQRFTADTGLIIPGPHQVVRISVVSVDGELGGGIYGVRFKRMDYTQDACTGGVCKFAVASENVSAPMPLMPGEALSVDLGPDTQGNGVRAVVFSNSRNVRVNVMIIDSTTGEVVAFQKHWEIIA